ncbi:MAG: hypothetical protein M1562_00830 [Candidatus Marsarchaeota archaeon]|jgi:uncharacterized membrane protein YcjF (UPF0283 family)|nr:hypothetical protein [Candidatus Marsarchaeota archaeon]
MVDKSKTVDNGETRLLLREIDSVKRIRSSYKKRIDALYMAEERRKALMEELRKEDMGLKDDKLLEWYKRKRRMSSNMSVNMARVAGVLFGMGVGFESLDLITKVTDDNFKLGYLGYVFGLAVVYNVTVNIGKAYANKLKRGESLDKMRQLQRSGSENTESKSE